MTDTPSIPPALTVAPLEAVAEWVRTIAHNAYGMGHRHGQLDVGMMRDVDYQSAREHADDYARTGFDAETVREHMPPIFTQEEAHALQEASDELSYKWSAIKLAPLESILAKIHALLPPK